MGVLHFVEGVGQLDDLAAAAGDRHVRCIVFARHDVAGRTDHLRHRVQQPDHRPGHEAAQHQADGGHHGLGPLHPAAEGGHLSVGALGVRDGGVQQLLGVLAQVAAAGQDLVVVEPGGSGIVAGADGSFQLFHKGGVAFIGGAHGAVEQIFFLAHGLEAAVDAPQPGVGGGKRAVQPVEQGVGVAVLPAVIAKDGQPALHAALKPADGVELAHLVVQPLHHGAGLIKAEKDLDGQCQQKGSQPQRDALLQRHGTMHRFPSLAKNFSR